MIFSIYCQQQKDGPGPEWSQAGDRKLNKNQTESQQKKSHNVPQQPPSQAEPNESSSALVIICHCLGGKRALFQVLVRNAKQRPSTHTPPPSLSPFLPHSPSRLRYFLEDLHINNTCTINSAFCHWANQPFRPFLIHLPSVATWSWRLPTFLSHSCTNTHTL